MVVKRKSEAGKAGKAAGWRVRGTCLSTVRVYKPESEGDL